jgi:hypothetical protein
VRRVAEAVTPPGLAPIHTMMVRQRVEQALRLWLAEFDPRPEWDPLGIELVVNEIRLDLLWRRRGQLRADELKWGRLSRWAVAQAEQQNDIGRTAFASAWAGVRLISLRGRGALRTIGGEPAREETR